ncbi:formin-binding protein, partial [Linderina pennispora]
MLGSFVFGKLGRDSASSQDNDAAAAAAGAPVGSSNLDTLRSAGAVSTAETADMHADFVCTERFADNFWSEDGRCVSVLTTKLKNAKQSCLDLLTMVSKRAEIEEELGKKMLKLSRGALGCEEVGTIKDAFRCVRVEMENTAKTHLDLAKQLRTELEKPFLGFMDDQKRKRRAQTSVIQKTEEERSQLRGMIRKLQDKRRSDTRKVGDLELQVNGLHGMGDPKLRNKLERAQAQQRATEKEYVDVRQRLHDADQQWYHVWRSACDVFQVLEEQRISYLKHIVWTFTNLVSSSFVTDDESMEKIRQDLERIDVASDISAFIRTFGTGAPDPELDPEGARASADRMSQDAASGNPRSQSTVLGTVSSAVPTPESTRPIHRTPTSNSQDSVPTESHGATMAGSVSQQPLSRPSTQQRMDPRQQHGPPLPVRNSSRPVSMHAQGIQALAGASAAEAAWNDRP